jgi:hypothetical protein
MDGIRKSEWDCRHRFRGTAHGTFASYESPKIAAVLYRAGNLVTEILVTGRLPDDQDGELMNGPDGNAQTIEIGAADLGRTQ